VAHLAMPAFLASASSTLRLQDEILDNPDIPADSTGTTLRQLWRINYSFLPPDPPDFFKQNFWDKPVIKKTKEVVWSNAVDHYSRARLAAASAPHSSDWLLALSIANCG
jgi:hypothetical protein